MRTLLFLRCRRNRVSADPQAIAAKVRNLVSSAGLRLIDFPLRRKSAPSSIEASCGSIPSDLRGALGLRAGGGEGESKDTLERSSFRRMLAHGSVCGNETGVKNGKFCAVDETFSL